MSTTGRIIIKTDSNLSFW